MSLSRFNALDTILNRETPTVVSPEQSIAGFFGCNVFGDDAMKEYMTEGTYLSVKAAIQSGQKLTREVAEKVADAMKIWAMSKGATHYTHWFQPLTGRTAEKHDSFFTIKTDGSAIEEFEGGALVQQEPDGSSFPGGGMRSTFEARGYTAWDPSSPAFILEVGEGKTLCIPTIFTTYRGEAMDYKLPLLRSQTFLEAQAIEVCKMFDEKVTRVTPTLGWEQEYFLIDEALFKARPDLFHAGRALVGLASAKGQQLDDHYFGAIPERVYAFMRDLETECHKLGIPVRTRHNEVAPAQYELAPMYEEVNVAIDHNTLLMDIMDRVAHRHRLSCILYEKPFNFINGSGKHNNWSMGTDTGKNLLSPGKDPLKNLQFLTFFVNIIKAVHEYSDLLRASVASSGNDHRLGANEAPPAIISVYCGEFLDKVLNTIENGNQVHFSDLRNEMDLLAKLPNMVADSSDRNRTSPFAFTGNKFEFRMVGSSANCSAPMSILNTIVGMQLKHFKTSVDALMDAGKDQEESILSVLRQYIQESKAIRFEGDGYSDEWVVEAAKRGLPNEPNSARAYDAYMTDKSKQLFKDSGVLNDRELEAHYIVKLEKYIKDIQIEAGILNEITMNHVLPAAIDYQTRVMQNIKASMDLDMSKNTYKAQMEIANALALHINGAKNAVETMEAAVEKAEHAGSYPAEAVAFGVDVKPHFLVLREHVDALEGLVDDKSWPLPKMRELLFVR
jgi:glutamine synthetase